MKSQALQNYLPIFLCISILFFIKNAEASNPNAERLKEVEIELSNNSLSNQQDSIDYADLLFKRAYYTRKSDVPKSLEYAEDLYAFANITNIPEVLMVSYHLKARIAKNTGAPEALEYYKTAEKYALETSSEVAEEGRMMINGEMATYLGYQGKFEEAEEILKKPLAYHQDKENFEHVCTIYNRLGVLNAQQAKYEEALSYFNKAIEAEKNTENDDVIIGIYGNCAKLLLLLDRDKEAVEYQLKALEKAEELSRDDLKAVILSSLTDLMINLKDYEEALKYAHQGLSLILEVGDQKIYIDIIASIGMIKYEQGKYSEAIDTLRVAYNNTDSIKTKSLLITRGIVLGNALYKTGKVDEAEKFLRRSLNIAIEGNFKSEIIQTQSELGFIYLEQGRDNEAFSLLEAAYETLKKDGSKNKLMVDVSKNLSLLNAKKRNYRAAYNLNIESEAILDTLDSKENIREITKLEKDFQFDQERKETELQRQVEMAEQKTIRTGLIIGLSALALLAFFIFRSNRNKAKANALLTEKNQQISAQNKQISEQKTALEKSNYTKDRIFAILGHDLRKPAAAFQGIARKVSYLLKKEDYAKIQELGEYFEGSALGFTSLIDNLLKWALTQKDAISINPEALDINQIITETKLVIGRLAEAKGVEIISEIPEGTKILADKNSMLTIIRNLIDNAIKYTAEGGSITLSAKESSVGIDLYIKDTGVGITEDKKNTIFLLQDGKSTQGTQGEKGTGLGLHLVQELVLLNQGKISVVSKLDEGTTFTIQLPKAA